MSYSDVPARFGTAAGLTTGMRVETAWGWRNAENLCAGDRVHAADGSERCLSRVEKTFYGAVLAERFPQGLVLVPGGALDNCEAFYLLPETHVLMTGEAVEALCGEGAALVRAADLVGHLGIIRALPVDGIEAIRLRFDEEEVIFANSGVLIHCPSEEADRGRVSRFFDVLGAHEVRVLMSCRSLGEPPGISRCVERGAVA